MAELFVFDDAVFNAFCRAVIPYFEIIFDKSVVRTAEHVFEEGFMIRTDLSTVTLVVPVTVPVGSIVDNVSDILYFMEHKYDK